jgi:hypothetical protein
LTIELFSSTYYSNILFSKGNKLESLLAIINGITPIKQNRDVENKTYIRIFAPKLQILIDTK